MLSDSYPTKCPGCGAKFIYANRWTANVKRTMEGIRCRNCGRDVEMEVENNSKLSAKPARHDPGDDF